MTDVWFSAQLRHICFVGDGDGVTSEKCIHVFRASGRDEAFARALALGHDPRHEQEYRNDAGALVQWRFERVMTLDDLGTAPLEGREVHSKFDELDPPISHDTTFDPSSMTPGETGVAVVDDESR
jgi:hypothetical protein